MMQVIIRVQIRASNSCIATILTDRLTLDSTRVGKGAGRRFLRLSNDMIQDIGSQSTLAIASATRLL
jgi:hypothetical protein